MLREIEAVQTVKVPMLTGFPPWSASIPISLERTPRILHEFIEKIIIHAATDPHSKINRGKRVGVSTTKVSRFENVQKYLIAGKMKNGIAEAIPFLSRLRMVLNWTPLKAEALLFWVA